jgi:hypothetical protein
MTRFLRALRRWFWRKPVFPDAVPMEFSYKYDPFAKIDRVTIEWRDMHGNLVSPKITPSEVSDDRAGV